MRNGISRCGKHLRRILTLLLAALLFAPAKAAADDLTGMSLETLMNMTVVGASRYEQKSSEAPSYTCVVTAEEIRKYGYRNLADLLRSVPGFFVTNDRNYQYAGIRGLLPPGDYNSRILLLVDGHRINNSIYDEAFVGNEFPIDIDLVERVEVVRGPSSSLYGSNAFFGIINVLTKQAGDYGGVELSGSAGSWRTFQGRATMGRELSSGPAIVVSGTVSDSHGQDLFYPEYNDPATNNGMAEDADGERFHDLFARIAWGDFALEGARGYRKKTVPTGSFGTTFNDNRTYTVDQSSYLDLRYEKNVPGDVNLMARLFYDDYRYWADYMYAPDVNKDFSSGRTWGGELKVVKTIHDDHRVTAGGEYRDNFLQDQWNYDVGVADFALDSRKSSTVWAVYLQDEFRINQQWILNAGVRYDRYSTFGGTTNPRIGLIYRPLEKTTAKLLYGRAFRTPSAYELYYEDNGLSQKANPGLQPEVVQTYEAVVEQHADLLGVRWKGTATAYQYIIRHFITAQLDPADGLAYFKNGDPIEAHGLELELEGTTPAGINGRASYAWQRAEDRGTGAALPNSPRDMLKLNLSLPLLPGKVFLSPELQYIGERKNIAGKAGGTVGGYALLNATLLAQKLPAGLELSVSVYNLLDKDYADPAGPEHLQDSIPQDGRNFRVKATCRF
ncbi:MAG: TonB-dependent receptor [Deltaproteobacteria bacterium]|nr:TonB-dependent receptor [Deltaproteobacteria bacterium]